MTRTLYTVERPGSPTAVPFEVAVDATLAPILSSLIGAVDVLVTDRLPNYVRQMKLILDTKSGGTVITHPYQMKVFEGDTDNTVKVLAEAFIAANPTYWFAPVDYKYSDQVARVSTRSLLFLLYNTDATDGAANWQPGYVVVTPPLPPGGLTPVPFTNGEATPLVFGEVCYMSGNATAKRALSTGTLAQAQAVCICDDATIAPGAIGNFVLGGRVPAMAAGKVFGDLAFLGATPGATATAPTLGAGQYTVPLGRWLNATDLDFVPQIPILN